MNIGNTIQYLYTNSQHKNPLCRVVPLEILQKVEKDGKEEKSTLNYDKDKYRENDIRCRRNCIRLFRL
jgi:hypothetical protein